MSLESILVLSGGIVGGSAIIADILHSLQLTIGGDYKRRRENQKIIAERMGLLQEYNLSSTDELVLPRVEGVDGCLKGIVNGYDEEIFPVLKEYALNTLEKSQDVFKRFLHDERTKQWLTDARYIMPDKEYYKQTSFFGLLFYIPIHAFSTREKRLVFNEYMYRHIM